MATAARRLMAACLAAALMAVAACGRAVAAGARLNHIQTVGVHNSYHVQPRRELLSLYERYLPQSSAWQYTHKTIPLLLAGGVRNFELDVYYDPKGGLYSNRAALRLIGQTSRSISPSLRRPGFKVMHIEDTDYGTTCLTFKQCLGLLRKWSVVNQGHLPISVKIEPKFQTLEELGGPQMGPLVASLLPDAATPFNITAKVLRALELEILSVMPKSRILTPDIVRGKSSTLLRAVEKHGWPKVRNLAGKFIFILVPDSVVETYRAASNILKGRLMFTGSSKPGSPDGAVVSIDNIKGLNLTATLRQNVIVFTRADIDTVEARNNDASRRDQALAFGAQLVATDYPKVEVPNPFGTQYVVELPGGVVARCNPVTASRRCQESELVEPIA
eukprot:SM000233S07976  [mRNA]  locus=s233:189937:193280:+ [translate_table: standard]